MVDHPRVTPVFLISLPRSGSTLLQKILSVSPQLTSTAEPWVMLPLAAMLDSELQVGQYWHATSREAIHELSRELAGGAEEFERMLGDFGTSLYSRLAAGSGARYFLDKTPRYYLITPFLARAFPHARFIFLFRNPAAVFSSIIHTWHRGHLGSSLRANYVDIRNGPAAIAAGRRLLGERAISVDYDALVNDPAAELARICDYLEIPQFDDRIEHYRSVQFSGERGDPTGIRRYGGVVTESVDQWERRPTSPAMRYFLREAIDAIDEPTLQLFGVEKAALLKKVQALPRAYRGSLRDAFGCVSLRVSLHLNRLALGQSWRSSGRSGLPYG